MEEKDIPVNDVEGNKHRHWLLHPSILSVFTILLLIIALFIGNVWRAERQRKCVQAISRRDAYGCYVEYYYLISGKEADGDARQKIHDSVFGWLGVDFFCRVADVRLHVLLPEGWNKEDERSLFQSQDCIVPDDEKTTDWERWGGGDVDYRPLKQPTPEMHLTADDWARMALRQRLFGCDKVNFHLRYCRKSLELDPHNIQASLLLGEYPDYLDDTEYKIHLQTVLDYANPSSLEYAHAKKLLSREKWTFQELCNRIGSDGDLH
jgi:hypothetical protein